MIKTRIKILYERNEKLFAAIKKRRILIADCKPTVEIYEYPLPA